jgi:hypothetical protein
MKISFLFLMVLLASGVFAQTSSTPAAPAAPAAPAPTPAPAIDSGKPLSEALAFIVGTFEGEGVSRGEHEFIGKMSVTSELEGNALLLRRESMNKAGSGPSGGLQELMIIGFDGTTKKIIGTLYDNKNAIALFVGELKENELVFSSTTVQPGYVSRRIFKQLADGRLSFVTEVGSPGKEVSKLVEINFKKM